MASRTLTINFLDANEADIVAALKDAASSDTPNPTKAQAWDWFERRCKANLRELVRCRKREIAVRAAEAAITDVDVT